MQDKKGSDEEVEIKIKSILLKAASLKFKNKFICQSVKEIWSLFYFSTAPGKGPAISPGMKPNLTRGTQARNTFHGRDARKQLVNPYNGPGGGGMQHPVDSSNMAGQRPSFFNRITSKFSRR